MSFLHLLKPIDEAYGLDLVSLEPIRGGLDPFSTTLQGQASNGSTHFVKIRSSWHPGTALASALSAEGIQEVLAPVRTVAGKPNLETDGVFVLVFPFVEGKNGIERPLSLAQWKQVGSALQRIHRSSVPSEVSLPTESFTCPGLEAFLKSLAQSPGTDLGKVLNEHRSKIEAAVQRHTELGGLCRRQDYALVPCHADLHAGNILTDEGGGVWLIDWDSPRLAPRECDLLFFRGSGILGLHGAAEEAAFFDGYGWTEPDLLLLTYYRYARLVEDFVAFSYEAGDSTRTQEERSGAVRGLAMQFKPGSTLDTALASDAKLTQQRPETR